MMEILKVSAKSNPNSVAGALAGVLREKGGAEIQAIGAGALNQAIKATAIAGPIVDGSSNFLNILTRPIKVPIAPITNRICPMLPPILEK